ncbi:MAG: DUF3263 domain-containing protein [Actinomycetota bacterium]
MSATREPAAISEGLVTIQLSDQEQKILAFERQWWKYAGAKEQAIHDLFKMSATRYYQLLNALIDRPEAVSCDPMLVKRLRRMRDARHQARSARRSGDVPQSHHSE